MYINSRGPNDELGIRKTSTVYSSNDKEKKNKGDDDDDDLLTIEDLLYTTLKKEGFAIEDSSPDYRVRGFEEVAVGERDGFTDYNRSALGRDSGSSLVAFMPKMQGPIQVISIAQRLPSTQQLWPLLLVSMDSTISVTTLRWFSACTTASIQTASIRIAPDPRPRHPILLALEACLHAAPERQQRTGSVKGIAFIPVEAQQTNANTRTG
ncbi:MAG: hypothetical protein M1813_002011 [Trichoglossum hirsutum]|nr:MAG: hypothetical protein M1813_002011 [Trichoglossum hirsutum]